MALMSPTSNVVSLTGGSGGATATAFAQIEVSQPTAATNAVQFASVFGGAALANKFPALNMLPLASKAFSNTALQYPLRPRGWRGCIHFVPWQLSAHESGVLNGAAPLPETHLYAVGALPSFH